MRANNLTISINAPCNKDCAYCISKMTFAPQPDHDLFCRNIKKAVYMASAAGVSSVMITSKGEPLLNMDHVMYVLSHFRDFPTEIQTNGTKLDENTISRFADMKLNTVAISTDNPIDHDLSTVLDMLTQAKINSRLTIVVTDGFKVELAPLISYCHAYGVRQLTLRMATAPMRVISNERSYNTLDWIKNNTKDEHKAFFDTLRSYQNEKTVIRKLPWGAMVHDVEGIAVTTIDYCIQEYNNYDDIRSLIYHQDGHLYTSWDKPSSLIF